MTTFCRASQVNSKDPNGFSPLHICALYNQVALARHLISIGGDARSANNWNDTPLHRAATQGYAEMCQLLLDAGADPDFEDWRNRSPADYAKEEVSGRMLSNRASTPRERPGHTLSLSSEPQADRSAARATAQTAGDEGLSRVAQEAPARSTVGLALSSFALAATRAGVCACAVTCTVNVEHGFRSDV